MIDTRISSRCKTIETAFNKFVEDLRIHREKTSFDLLDIVPDPSGLTMNQHVLFDTILYYFRDLDRYKDHNGFGSGERANPIKVGAFSTFWLASKCPIFDNKGTKWAPLINNKFAIYTGLTLANIDPHAASLIDGSLPYKQLDQILSTKTCSSDSLVPIFQLLKILCPHKV
jgi:hypothetical protein